MDGWEILRSLAAAFAVVVALSAFVVARRDKHSEATQTALNRVEQTLGARIDAIVELGEARHAPLSARIAELNARFAGLDEALKSIPNHRDFDTLQSVISTVAQAVAKQQGALESNTRMVERMNSYLMERGT